MSRRHTKPKYDDEGNAIRSSLTDNAVENACIAINRKMQRAVRVLTRYDVSVDATIKMLFTDDQIERARRALNLVRPESWTVSYPVNYDAAITSPYAYLNVNFDKSNCLPLDPARRAFRADLISPLNTFISEVTAIVDQYNEVKEMLRWFNRNATMGAIRYYWPTAMQLCPEQFRNYQEVPARFNTPAAISDRLQMIRYTAATWAGAQMLPEVDARQRGTMWLTINQHKVEREGVTFHTDQAIFNI